MDFIAAIPKLISILERIANSLERIELGLVPQTKDINKNE